VIFREVDGYQPPTWQLHRLDAAEVLPRCPAPA
jgi:hypothetical protein